VIPKVKCRTAVLHCVQGVRFNKMLKEIMEYFVMILIVVAVILIAKDVNDKY